MNLYRPRIKQVIHSANMSSHWVIWLVVAGFAYASGNQCDTDVPKTCYEDLVHYETLVFPFYGSNESKLEETCSHINSSLYCVEAFAEMCQENEECVGNCTSLIQEIHGFLRITGLFKLSENLCNDSSPLRKTYLESTDCLEKNADLYAGCHNDSQESQHYMHTTPGANTVEASCCYLSWYKDCFTNITRDHCGEDATFFVSFGVHSLLGDIAEQLCAAVPSTCDRPPLPTDVSTDEPTEESNEDNEIDKEKPDPSENEIDDKHKFNSGNTRIKSYAAHIMALSYIIVMSKYFL